MSIIRFPEGFLWGAATSAYQIEGSPLADGAGASIWHRFSHTPGRVANGDTGDEACDHYRRSHGDVNLMRDLGLTAYRFSLAWGRILPEGRGKVNVPGLDFYSRLVDALLENGIAPCATLYHWDLPAALEDAGGWSHPEIAPWFAEYASIVFRALGDRVRLWMTLNEPWVIVDCGYVQGIHAPGHRDLAAAPRVAQNLLRAHGLAVLAFRALRSGEIGVVVNLEPKVPASDLEEDRAAAARADAYMNRFYLDAILRGEYPAESEEIFGAAWFAGAARELDRNVTPIDFLGVNYYTRTVVRNAPESPPARAAAVAQPGSLRTETGWEVHPEGLMHILLWVKERYGDLPIYITENGAAFEDPPRAENRRVDDPLRVAYFQRHIRAAHEAMALGVNLRGYFAWSLLDNFEWAEGYSKRFGLYHVDFGSQERTPKTSALFYRDVIATRGAALGVASG